MSHDSDLSRRISRRQFLLRTGATGLALGTSGCVMPKMLGGGGPATGRRPNLIYVFADQLRPMSLQLDGEKMTQTPRIDRFAREGVVFSNCCSMTPVCAPYRACMLTGRYPHVNGVITNGNRILDRERTFGEILKGEGYNTAYIGKWHLNGPMNRRNQYVPPGPAHHGFDYWMAFNFNHNYNRPRYFSEGPEPIMPEAYQMDFETDRAIEYINRQTADQPFTLFMSWGPPHPPYSIWNMPKRYVARYGTVEDVALADLPANERRSWSAWQQPYKFTPRQDLTTRKDAGNRPFNLTEIATYYAMIDWVDDSLGRLLDALEAKGLADDTIIVFSSDHGEMLNSHDTRGKMIYYDESVRIPFYVRWPRRIKAETVSDACITNVDFLPTLLGLMGVAVPDNVNGMNLAHCCLGRPGPEPEGAILASYSGYEGYDAGWAYRGVRTKRYTYVRSRMQLWRWYGGWGNRPHGTEPEYFLYDNEKDPYQMTNVVDQPAYRATRERLEGLVKDYLRRSRDAFLTGPEYRKFYDDEGRQIAFPTADTVPAS